MPPRSAPRLGKPESTTPPRSTVRLRPIDSRAGRESAQLLGDPAVSVETARGVGPGGIDIAYERFGDPVATPVLLIMGLGTQMLGWPDPFCELLAARRLHVIRFDNRDIGLSTHLTDAPQPDVSAAFAG